jgi:AraC family transcriptional regulator
LHSDHFGTLDVRCFIIETESKWLTSIEERSIHLNEPQSLQGPPLSWLAMKLRNEARQADDFTSLTIEGLMLELVAEIARISLTTSARRPPRWLNHTREVLHEHFAQQMSLTEIAACVGVHPVYLATVFRQHYNCTVGEYVRRLRVEFASRELSNTATPLAEIALAAGFAHQSHFARTFKRLTGLTPAQYRSANRQP